jgi:hypothetical protein
MGGACSLRERDKEYMKKIEKKEITSEPHTHM